MKRIIKRGKHSYICLGLLGLGIAIISSCGLPLLEINDGLSFPDFAGSNRSTIGGVQGSLAFADTKVGEEVVKPITIKNDGTAALSIGSVAVIGESFDFPSGIVPELPITLKPGESKTLFVAFLPVENGNQSGRFVVSTTKNERVIDRYVELEGRGMWELTLSLNEDTAGKITSPANITTEGAGGEQKLLSVTGVFTLTGEAAFLRKFSTWSILNTPLVNPEFVDQKAASTTVTIKDHTTIQGVFTDPWVFSGTTEATLRAAITTVTGTPGKEGVIVQNGTIAISADLVIPNNVALVGGYDNGASPTARKYLTVDDREGAANSPYQAKLQFTGTTGGIIVEGGTGVIIEGLTIQNISSANPPLTLRGNASGENTALIQYNSILGAGSAPAILVTAGKPSVLDNRIQGGAPANASSAALRIETSAPQVLRNEIHGGNPTGSYAKSHGIYLYDNANPTIYKNTINGGSAGTSGLPGARTYGLYIDWESKPLIVGNTINGGNAIGQKNASTQFGLAVHLAGMPISTGIYFINNGKSTLRYNTISGGNGSDQSIALYSAYGSNFYLDTNNITTGASNNQYGIYLGTNGRVRMLKGNGFTNVGTSFQYKYLDNTTLESIDDLNSTYNSNSNKAELVTFVIPDEVGVQEWEK